jgi:transmembrane sensor
LLIKQLLGEASPEEEQQVLLWLDQTPANQDYYNQFKKIWDSSKALSAHLPIDENKQWEKFQQRIKNEAPGNAEASPINRRRYSWMKIAASVILILGIGIVSYLLTTKEPLSQQIIAQASEHVLIDTLPDGSIVTLNKKSSLAYSSVFKGNSRPVTLKGEAFFNVAHDNKKPFIISINNVQVTVVGTSFNIRNEHGNTEIIVETGIVRVSKAEKTIELTAGEKIFVHANDNRLKQESVTDKLYNYYRSKAFVCDNTPLWKLVEVLNEAYETNITIGRKELNDMQLTATFNNESLEKVLKVIQLTFDIKVNKNGEQIILQ